MLMSKYVGDELMGWGLGGVLIPIVVLATTREIDIRGCLRYANE